VKPANESRNLLARCNGFLALASDAPLEEVETPVFAADCDEPDYLLVRLSHAGGGTAVVPTSLVAIIEAEPRRLKLRASLAEVLQLPARLPVAPHAPRVPERSEQAPARRMIRARRGR
jgi:hypothetical protein